jgi:hypothetical protein
MSALLEEVVTTDTGTHWQDQWRAEWSTVNPERAETTFIKPYGAPDVYGVGHSYSATDGPALRFVAKHVEVGEDGGVFAFSGLGSVYDDYRRRHQARGALYVKGTATRTFRRTSFLETFDGYAFVSDDADLWSANTTSLYQVTGVRLARPPARRARYQKPSRAYETFKELGAWLEMSDEELAPIVDVARGTVSRSWKSGHEPRKRAQARRLFQLHAAVSATRSLLGDEFVLWLKHGSPCPLQMLVRGELDRFERATDAVIFPPSPTPRRRLDAAQLPSDPGTARPEAERTPFKRAIRVRSRRLAQ